METGLFHLYTTAAGLIYTQWEQVYFIYTQQQQI